MLKMGGECKKGVNGVSVLLSLPAAPRGYCKHKIEEALNNTEEIGTNADLGGHCYNADDRIIKV